MSAIDSNRETRENREQKRECPQGDATAYEALGGYPVWRTSPVQGLAALIGRGMSPVLLLVRFRPDRTGCLVRPDKCEFQSGLESFRPDRTG